MPSVVKNWLGNVRSEVEGIDRPASIGELQEIVGNARGRLLVTGACMSKTAVVEPRGGRAIDMSGLAAILAFGEDDVVAQAGITVYEVSRALYAKGRQLPGFTITANPTLGGSIAAPTKGSNHPFNPRANGVSGAVRALKVVRPSGELLELRAGEHDAELALLKDSYGAAGVIAEARLATVPLASALVHDEVLPLRSLLDSADEQARALEQRTLLFPKLGCAVVRVHEDVRRAEPGAPFEGLVEKPDGPYPRLARSLPRFARAKVLAAAVRLGSDRRRKRRLHIQNLTLYPADGSSYLDFITWSMAVAEFPASMRRIVEFCRAHPAYPPESLIEVFRVFPEARFLDSDERVAIDPVSFDRGEAARWEVFYRDYNRLMVGMGASPYLNQTRYLEADDLRRVYGRRYEAWREALLSIDPSRKLGSTYLDRVLGFV